MISLFPSLSRCFARTLFSLSLAGAVLAPKTGAADAKQFIDYFKPMPIVGKLDKAAWGAAEVGPRDQQNGLEDVKMAQWNYWDGQIVKGSDGKFHLFASRWDQSLGHSGWSVSKAIHSVSGNLIGPYVDKGLCWPNDQQGKGHNVTALMLPDGRYCVVVSDTRPGDVFASKSPDGPWEYLGSIKLEPSQFTKKPRMCNLSVMARPDGGFQIVPRYGNIWISKNSVVGPYVEQGPSVFLTVPELAKLRHLEDPVVWYSGNLYHIVVNEWYDRKAYHITSADGIHDWKFRGVAYDPTKDFLKYEDGTVNRWHKLERPGVVVEKGHVVAMTFALMDTPKETQLGNNGHGSKIIVVPFDGEALDRDIQAADAAKK